jgi:hypothetical protein
MDTKDYKGMIWPIDMERRKKFEDMPKFNFHPDYPDHEVFVIVDKNGKPAKTSKLQYFQQIRFGRLLYKTSIIETGDMGLLVGEAYNYYLKYRNQFERKMIRDFRRYDVYHNKDDTIGIAVHVQKDGWVYYYKYPKDNIPSGKFWQKESSELKKKRIGDFARAVMKINPKRYSDLIHPDLLSKDLKLGG